MNAPAPLTQRSSLKDRFESAIKSGASTDELKSELTAACAASPNAAWEALSLIDQHFRRRNLTQDAYRALKAHVQGLALGRPVATDKPAAPAAATATASANATANSNGNATGPAPAPAHARVAPTAPAVPVAPPKGEPTLTLPPAPARGGVRGRAAEAAGQAPTASFAPAAHGGDASVAPGPSAQTRGAVTPRPGLVLRGRYLLESRLDYGNGLVYQAVDEYRNELPDEEQRVAIRFPSDAADAQREFFRAQHLSHPNIARVIEFDRDGGLAFYTMELQPGRLLRDVLKQAERLPLLQETALRIVREIAAALEHAHSRGVVHGRLDTSSVRIVNDGSVRVLNFGLPRQDGDIIEPIDDLRALTLLAYELLAGYPAFDGLSRGEARARGLHLRRPSGLQRRQWRALQRGIATPGRKHALTLAQWLQDLELQPAGAHASASRPFHDTVELLRRRRLLLAGVLAAFAAALVTIVINWQTLVHSPSATAPGSARSAAERATASRAPSAAPGATAAGATPAGSSPGGSAPSGAVPPAPAMASTATPPPVEAAADMPAPAAAPASPPASALSTFSAPPATGAGAPAAAGDGGAGLLAFRAEAFTVAPGESAARIPVQRIGGTRGDVGFVWWTESGTARAGDDFVSFGEQRELIPAGQKSVSLYVPLSGGTRTAPTEFYVNIGDPSGGARLGAYTRLRVLIAPDL